MSEATTNHSWNKWAADEIDICMTGLCETCRQSCGNDSMASLYEGEIKRLAATIARHAREREGVLRATIAWMIRGGAGCPTPARGAKCDKGDACDDEYAAQCWIDHWTREVARRDVGGTADE